MEFFTTPDLLIAYALIQSATLLFLIRFLDLYEREPLSIVVAMAIWGGIGAGGLALLGNAFVRNVLPSDVSTVFGASISAPPVEELAKGIALVAAFAASQWANRRYGFLEFEGVTDGIVYGAAIGIGFAFTEDLYYLTNGLLEGGAAALKEGEEVFLLRRDFLGLGSLGHAVYTGVFGAGLGLATWVTSRTLKVVFPMLGLLAAMLLHAIHNGFAELWLVVRYGWDTTAAALAGQPHSAAIERSYSTAYRALGLVDFAFVVAFFGLIALWLRHQRRVIRDELRDEVARNLITQAEWELMPRYWRRSKLYWRMLREGRFEVWRLMRRVHNELADLAFLKWRTRFGDTGPEIDRRRARVSALKALEPSATAIDRTRTGTS